MTTTTKKAIRPVMALSQWRLADKALALKLVRNILRRKNGFDILMNAIFATGSALTRGDISGWLDGKVDKIVHPERAEARFLRISPAEECDYGLIRDWIDSFVKARGLAPLLSAMVDALPDDAYRLIQRWVDSIESIDDTDLVAYCFGSTRLIAVKT